MSPHDINHLIQIIGISVATLSTIVGLLVLFHKKVMIPVIFIFHGYKKLVEKVDAIYFELQSNNGKSLKDTVNNISTHVKRLDERHKILLSNTDQGHFETDSEGKIIWVNRTLVDELNCIPSELLGNGWHNFISQEEREEVLTIWQNSIKEGIETTLRFTMVAADSAEISVLLHSHKLVASKGGELLGFFGTIFFIPDSPIN